MAPSRRSRVGRRRAHTFLDSPARPACNPCIPSPCASSSFRDPSLVIGSFRAVRSSRNGPSVHDPRASVMKLVGARDSLDLPWDDDVLAAARSWWTAIMGLQRQERRHAGVRSERRRGLEPAPGHPGPGPEPGDPGVISARIAPERLYRPGSWTIRTQRTIWTLPRLRASSSSGGYRPAAGGWSFDRRLDSAGTAWLR